MILKLKKIFLFSIGILFFGWVSTANAQFAPNASLALTTAYQNQLAAIQTNTALMQKIATANYGLTTSNYNLTGNPVTQDAYTQYQAATQKAALLNQQLQKIIDLSNAYQSPLSATTPPDVQTNYANTLQQYQQASLSNILSPSAAGAAQVSTDGAALDNIAAAYNQAATQNVPAQQLDALQQTVNTSSTLAVSSPFQTNTGSTFVYDFLVKLFKYGMKFLKQIIFTDLANILKIPFEIGVTLWIMFIGAKIFFGKEVDWASFLQKLAVITLISTFVFTNNGQLFFDWIMLPLMNTFFGLATWFLQESTAGTSQPIPTADWKIFAGTLIVENLFSQSLEIGKYIYKVESGLSLSAIFQAALMFLVFVGGFWFVLLKFGQNFAYSLFSLIVFFSLAPLMLCFFAFAPTRPTCITWFRGVVNALTLPVLTSLAIGIFANMLLRDWAEFQSILSAQMQGTAPSAAPFPMIKFIDISGLVWLTYLILIRIDDVTAFLTGGISPNLTNIVLQFANTLANSITAGVQMAKFAGVKAADHLPSNLPSGLSNLFNRDNQPLPPAQ